MRPWTTSEERVIRELACLGRVALGDLLERSADSVAWKASELGVSLRQGNLGTTHTKPHKDLISRVASAAAAGWCPSCGSRPATMKTGLCRVCHCEELIRAHNDERDARIAQQRLDLARQQKHRATVCPICGEVWYPRKPATATVCKDCRS